MQIDHQAEGRPEEGERPPEQRVLRFPYLLGGSPHFQALSPLKRLQYLQTGKNLPRKLRLQRFLQFDPGSPGREEEFSIAILKRPFLKSGKKLSFIRMEVRMPSGSTHRLEFLPEQVEESADRWVVPGFRSQAAGDLYASARLYFSDGSTLSDARTTLVLSRNPDFLVISPRVWLVSGRAGRVEYDWDTNEFHCRAYADITNGSGVTRTYDRCSVQVWDGGVGSTSITSFSFGVGPFSVSPGGTAYRVVDTWYPQGSNVWDKFNRRWDLTLEFTYEATDGTRVTDNATYRPMSTIPINLIETTDFTGSQVTALSNGLQIATEILEDRDITLYGPYWRIISDPINRARFGTIDIGWSDDDYDFDEAKDMYEEISGPESDRLDVFIPLAFNYLSSVPADKRNVGGFSTLNGPFPKDDAPRRSGSLVLMDELDHEFLGVAIAHEICHYLELDHVDADDNLMQENGGLTGHILTWDQWNAIIDHGMMKWLAPDI
jgi:hypothetical protein